MTDSITFAKFEPILEEFANFQKFRQMKQTSKMLQSQLNYKNMSQVNHDWLKVSFLIKRHVSMMCRKLQVIAMQYGELPNEQTYHRGKTLKGIKEKSGRFQEST